MTERRALVFTCTAWTPSGATGMGWGWGCEIPIIPLPFNGGGVLGFIY